MSGAPSEAEIKEVFDTFDADGSGQIDASELESILTQLNVADAKAIAKTLIEEADTDHSGKISYAEFKAAVLS